MLYFYKTTCTSAALSIPHVYCAQISSMHGWYIDLSQINLVIMTEWVIVGVHVNDLTLHCKCAFYNRCTVVSNYGFDFLWSHRYETIKTVMTASLSYFST